MRRNQLAGLILFCVTFAVFSRGLVGDFVQWDDDVNIYANRHIQGLSATNLHWIFTTCEYPPRYVPLSWLGWAINYQLGGLNPVGFHLTDLLFHCANAVLVFLLIQRLLLLAAKDDSADGRHRRVWLCSAVGACLWALHPLRVESVAWAAGRNYVQPLFFLLTSVLCYLRFQAEPERKVPGKFYWMSVLCFAASLLSYPIGLALVLVLVVLDFYPLRRFQPGLAGLWDATACRIYLEKVPYAVVSFLALEATLLLRASNDVLGAPLTLEQFGIGARAMQACYVWAYYLWKPWVPVHLCPVYTTLVQFGVWDWPFLLSAVLVIGLTLVLVWRARRWPAGLALWICYLALLVPFLGLTEHPHYSNDRYGYLPGILWSVLIAAALLELSRRARTFAWAAAAMIVAAGVLGAMSFRQIRVWRDSVNLFEYMIGELGTHPYRSAMHWRLGKFYAEHGRPDDALRQYETSLRIRPDAIPFQLQGELLERQGNGKAALTNYLAALQLRPDPAVHHAAGLLLCGLGRNGEAIYHYRQALKLAPDWVPTLNNLAWMLATDGDAGDRDGAEAVQLAERLCALSGRRVPAFLKVLAAAYAEAGRFREAVETAQAAQDMATEAKDQPLADRCRKMVELYRSGRPYRQPAGAPVD